MHMIRNCSGQVMRGEPLLHQPVPMAPLLTLDRCELDDLPFDEALECGHPHITELSGSGSVAALWLINRVWQALMLSDVADVDGAKHERDLNFSLLTSPAALTIPISYVEAGRRALARPAFLMEIAAAHASTHPPVEEGKDVHLTAHRLSEGAWLAQDREGHLCACRLRTAESQDTHETPGRVAIASVRRRERTS